MDFDEAYQVELLNKMTSRKFLEKTGHLIRPEFFDPDLEPLVKRIMGYWKTHKQVLTIPQVNQLFRKYDLKKERVSLDGIHFDLEELECFAKDRILREAMLKSHAFREQGRFDKAIAVISEAPKRFPQNNGALPDMLKNLKPLPRRKNQVPTGIETLDRALDGGVTGGDVACVMAQTGGGKTTFLCSLSASAAERGLKVFYATLEVPGLEVQGKLRRRLTGHLKPSQARWKKTAGKLTRKRSRVLVLEHPPNTISVSELEQQIPEDTGLIVVDYADKLRSVDGQFGGGYEMLGVIYDELKRVSLQKQIPVWTASQTNRMSYGVDRAELEAVEGSLKKAMNSNLVVSLNQSKEKGHGAVDEETGNSQMVLSIIKNTFGPKDVDIDLTVNWAQGSFEEGHYG